MIGNFLFLSAEYFFLSSQELLSNSLHYLDIKKLLSEHHNKLESIISLFQASWIRFSFCQWRVLYCHQTQSTISEQHPVDEGVKSIREPWLDRHAGSPCRQVMFVFLHDILLYLPFSVHYRLKAKHCRVENI